jgi:hypothetical protein
MKYAPLVGVALAVFLASSPAPVAAADGVLMVVQSTDLSGGAASQIQIEPHRMRMATPAPVTHSMVFDGTKGVLWMIDYEQHSYMETTRADAERMARMMGGIRAAGRGDSPAKVVYRKAGTAKVGRWTCDKYESYVDGEKTSELCTVDPKVLGLTAGDLAVARQYADFLPADPDAGQQLLATFGTMDVQGFAGVVVRQLYFRFGDQSGSALTDVRRASFPESDFQVPAGFTKEALFGKH